jgi:hypothetical protein
MGSVPLWCAALVAASVLLTPPPTRGRAVAAPPKKPRKAAAAPAPKPPRPPAKPKIPVAPLSGPREIKLFNGTDWTGWTFFLEDPALKVGDVWRIEPKDGVIVCKGRPAGYLRTVKDYTNFILRLEWRFNPVTKEAGNSGVLLRAQSPDKIWPRSIEAQLQSGAAGDFWLIDGFPLETPPERVDQGAPQHRLRTRTNEKPLGEWNEYEIVCDGGKVIVRVNGETLNEGTNAAVLPGKIALQSEGTEIHFRNIRLTPLR